MSCDTGNCLIVGEPAEDVCLTELLKEEFVAVNFALEPFFKRDSLDVIKCIGSSKFKSLKHRHICDI